MEMKRNSEIVTSSLRCYTNCLRFIVWIWFGVYSQLLSEHRACQTNGFYAFQNIFYALNARKRQQQQSWLHEDFNFSSLKCGMNSDDNGNCWMHAKDFHIAWALLKWDTFKWRVFSTTQIWSWCLCVIRFCFSARIRQQMMMAHSIWLNRHLA